MLWCMRYMIRDFINSDRFYNQAERVNKNILYAL